MKKIALAGLLPAILGGCVTSESTLPPEVLTFRSPIDARAGIRNTYHHNIIGSYNHREPVEPKSWRELNEERMPKPEVGS